MKHSICIAPAAWLALLACGARTGLDVPDASEAMDAPVLAHADGGPDAPLGCVDGTFTLTQRASDAVLVIDRSGSMADGLPTPRDPSKWTVLRSVLGMTLPVFADQIEFGALFFPQAGVVSRSASCDLAIIPDLDVNPAPAGSAAVLAAFDSHGPSGATPTAAALLRAYEWFARHPDRSRAHNIVLATDGAPNCNPMLDPLTCTCAMGMAGGCARRAPNGDACLDDMHTVQEISQIASNPVAVVPTYVIGLAAASDPIFATTLTAMAIAGGRPNIGPAGTPTYYDVERPEELDAAFTTIADAISRCSFIAPSRPDSPDAVTLTIDGVAIARDTTHMDGWDWTDPGFGELTVFGSACAQAAAGPVEVAATVHCAVDGG